MKVIGLDGKEHILNYIVHSSTRDSTSKYHAKARDLLKQIFPLHQIYEEVTLPGTKTGSTGKSLYADFFIPQLKIIVEVQGEQHYTYSSFYHKNKFEFIRAKNRDYAKKEFCGLNEITLVELPYSENEDEWRQRIVGR
jgi:hypothetical protein